MDDLHGATLSHAILRQVYDTELFATCLRLSWAFEAGFKTLRQS